VQKVSLLIGWTLAPMAVIWALLSTLLPDTAGRALLGESWDLARPLLVLAGFSIAAGQFAIGTAVGIRALGAGRHGLAARLVVSVMALVCAAIGGVVDGAHGVMLILALTAPVQVATWWWLLVQATRAARRDLAPLSRVVADGH
jgi:hypothetical protein